MTRFYLTVAQEKRENLIASWENLESREIASCKSIECTRSENEMDLLP